MNGFLPLIRREWRLLGFAVLMTFGSSFGQTFFIALFAGDVRDELDLSNSTFGSLYSAATLCSAGLLLWSGQLIDRWDLRRYSLLVCLGLGAGCALLGTASGAASLFIGLLVLRHMGQSLMSLAGITSVVRYIQTDRGKASALTTGGFALGDALLPSAAVALIALAGWRSAWLACAVGIVALLPPLVLFLLRNHDRRHRDWLSGMTRAADDGSQADNVEQRQWTRSEMLRDPLLYLYLPALMVQPLLFTGFMFHQVALVDEKGWTITFWASLYTLYALVATVCKLIAGIAIDRFGASRMLPLMVLPFAGALVLIATVDAQWAAVGFMTLLGVTTGLYTTAASPFYAERYGTLHLGAIKSVTTAVMVSATAVTPVLMGIGLDGGTSITTMAWFGAGYAALTSALAALANRLSGHLTEA